MVFEQIRYRLLWSYLAVLMAILAAFAIVVRTVFARTLYHQSIDRLSILGQNIVANVDYENGVLNIDNDIETQELVEQRRALEWFDWKGEEIEQQGQETLSFPIWPKRPIQIQKNQQLLGVVVPIVDQKTNRTVGYLRISESLEGVHRELRSLDLGLGGGILIALTLSGVGGIWLTRQAMQPIEQSFQRLQQFTADASHELRSPLMAIKSNAAVALKYPEGIRASDAEKFESIASAIRQMTHLTEDLLFLARNDRMPHRTQQSIDMTALLTQLVQLYQTQSADQCIHLKSHIKDSLWVLGDSAQLTRLFTNLIDNALHYTPAGGLVEVNAERTNSHLEIQVQDTGIGIAPEQIGRVFDRFWRADRSRVQWDGGAGLGLSIAQSIAKGHQGQITVTSQPDIGSCFTVRLPALDPKTKR